MAAERKVKTSKADQKARRRAEKPARRPKSWKAPSLQDVSGEVMAQPYIRFT